MLKETSHWKFTESTDLFLLCKTKSQQAHLSMSGWEGGDGDMFNPSSVSADSRIALFFLLPGQTGSIMLAIGSDIVQLLHGSAIASALGRPLGLGTQPAGQRGQRGPVPVAQLGSGPEPGIKHPGGHITLASAQLQPAAHILLIIIAPAAGGPGGSKGSFWSQDSFMKQRVDVVRVVVTMVLVT